MNGWQPIETAPKDGRWVFVTGQRPPPLDEDEYWMDFAPVRVVRWAIGETTFHFQGPDASGLYRRVEYKAPDYWRTEFGGHVDDPTHWMPLPEPLTS